MDEFLVQFIKMLKAQNSSPGEPAVGQTLLSPFKLNCSSNLSALGVAIHVADEKDNVHGASLQVLGVKSSSPSL